MQTNETCRWVASRVHCRNAGTFVYINYNVSILKNAEFACVVHIVLRVEQGFCFIFV